jgi:hypothetical protein
MTIARTGTGKRIAIRTRIRAEIETRMMTKMGRGDGNDATPLSLSRAGSPDPAREAALGRSHRLSGVRDQSRSPHMIDRGRSQR